MSTKSKHGKASMTLWKVIESFDQMTLVEVTLVTGRTHQIRVHFSDGGHPLVGDKTYGGVGRTKGIVDLYLKQAIQKLPALLLHAEFLSFDHPISRKRLSFSSPLPTYFENILKFLHE